MSRLGKKPVLIPEKTTVTVTGGRVAVKGPLGELSRDFKPSIAITAGEKQVVLSPKSLTNETRALWGTYVSHIKNMIRGVNAGFQKRLLIEGIGFKAEVKGNEIVLSLGFSHPVAISVPKGLKVTTEKGAITVSGIDKESVGQFAAQLRALKEPEPYKGKGIRYEREVIIRKQGKKAATAAA